MSCKWLAIALALSAGTLNAAEARDKKADESPPPREYRNLMACRTVAQSAERLACFDRQAASLDAATQSRQVVISDRQAVTQARRGLFGFAAPVGKLLGFGGDDEEIKQIKSILA